MAKQVRLRLYPDGRVQAETAGIKGPACASVLPLLEQLLDAEVVESAWTEEYYQTAEVAVEQKAEQTLRGET